MLRRWQPRPPDGPVIGHPPERAVPELDDAELEHARVDAEHFLDGHLRGGRAVEAHDEVVPVDVARLVLRHGFRQEVRAPIGDAAHDPALRENDLPGCAGDPRSAKEGDG